MNVTDHFVCLRKMYQIYDILEITTDSNQNTFMVKHNGHVFGVQYQLCSIIQCLGFL